QPEGVRVDLRLFDGDRLNDPDEVIEQVDVWEDEEVVVAHDVSGALCTVALGELGQVLLVELWQTSRVASAVLVAPFQGGMAPRESSGYTIPLDGRPLRVPADAEVGKGGKGGLVHEAGMVPIYPVFSLEFPIALVAIFMGEQDLMLALQAAVSPQIDEVLDRAEVLLQAGDLSAQAGENKAPVDSHAGSLHEIEILGAEPLRIARTVSDPNQLAGVGVDPGMVRTPEVQGVPALLPANGIGPMPADIEEYADVTVLAPRDD